MDRMGGSEGEQGKSKQGCMSNPMRDGAHKEGKIWEKNISH